MDLAEVVTPKGELRVRQLVESSFLFKYLALTLTHVFLGFVLASVLRGPRVARWLTRTIGRTLNDCSWIEVMEISHGRWTTLRLADGRWVQGMVRLVPERGDPNFTYVVLSEVHERAIDGEVRKIEGLMGVRVADVTTLIVDPKEPERPPGTIRRIRDGLRRRVRSSWNSLAGWIRSPSVLPTSAGAAANEQLGGPHV